MKNSSLLAPRWRFLPWWLLTLAIVVIVLFPIYWMVMTAVMPPERILSTHPSLVPDFAVASLAAFRNVFSIHPLLTWVVNSLGVGLAATTASLVTATFAGYSLSRWAYRPQQALGAMLLFVKLIPATLIIIPLYIIFIAAGLIDSYVGLVLAHMTIGVPLATWLMKGFFDRVPRELEQAAMIDGCSHLQALRWVILPLTLPGLSACTIYLLIVSWSEFIFARTLMKSDPHQMLTVGLQSFVGEHQVDWSGLMAAGTVSLLPVMILFVLLEPFLVSGLTKGALAN
jgi:multiple sugar transport system permease protein